MLRFYQGWNQPNNGVSGASQFTNCLISINRLLNRKSQFKVNNWILDSGSFTRLQKRQHLPLKIYAQKAKFFANSGNLEAIVCQDIPPKDKILKSQKLNLELAQGKTIRNYIALKKLLPKHYVMPVLQGIKTTDYSQHLKQYQSNIEIEAWVGIGNLVGRKNDEIEKIIVEIKNLRPDLKLHGFGIKLSNVENYAIANLLYSADSACGAFRSDDWRRSHGCIDSTIKYQKKVVKTAKNSRPNLFQQHWQNQDEERTEYRQELEYIFLQNAWNQAYGEDSNDDDNDIYDPDFATPWD